MNGAKWLLLLLLGAVLPATRGHAAEPAAAADAYHITCDLLGVPAAVADAVTARDAEAGWALEALNAELQAGRARRVASCAGVVAGQELQIEQYTLTYCLTGYEAGNGLALPQTSDQEERVEFCATIKRNVSLTYQLTPRPVAVIKTPAGEIQSPGTRSGVLLEAAFDPAMEGLRVLRAGPLPDGSPAVAVCVLRNLPPVAPSSGSAQQEQTVRLQLLRLDETAFQNFKAGVSGYPALGAEALATLRTGARTLLGTGDLSVGKSGYRAAHVARTVSQYLAPKGEVRANAPLPLPAPVTNTWDYVDEAEVLRRDKGGLCASLSLHAPFEKLTLSSACGPVELPRMAGLSYHGGYPQRLTGALVVAEMADPACEGMLPLFAQQAATTASAASGDTAASSANASATTRAPARLLVVLEAAR